MDPLDQKLLTSLQVACPIVAQPWAEIGAELNLAGDEVMQRVGALKDSRVIRQISAIFDTKSLGYRSSLVAARYEPSRLDTAAAIISAHPGVSHNYQRDHVFNLWYTIAVAPTSRLGLEKTVDWLHTASGALSTRLMPTLHLFKIGVELDLEGTGKASDKGAVRYGHQQRPKEAAPLSELEIRFIRAMQQDLAIEAEPFVAMAGRLGVSLAELQQLTNEMTANGRLRRFSAVLRHREIGFSANGMGVWAVPGTDADILRVGEQMATFRAVTHCYRRPSYPDWPYNIFTMIHARTKDECAAVVTALAAETGVRDHGILYSTKEYKKTRVQYFTDAEEQWEQTHAR